MKNKEIIKEILHSRLKPNIPKTFNLDEICFKEQRDFILDQSPWVTASCSRRAGKSIGCAIDLMLTAATNSKITCLYITLTKDTARKLVWKSLLELNSVHGFGAATNITQLSLTFPNESVIYCTGCNDKAEIEKFRGGHFKLVYLDEVQSFPHFLEELVDQVLGPALLDDAGSLKFIGTPGPLKRGYFWNILQSKIYSHHSWTFWNNPYLPAIKSGKETHQSMLDRELTRRGTSLHDSSVRREWFGEWADDKNALVCLYDNKYNSFDELPHLTDYVIGIDLGFNDADAIAVLGWHKNLKICYLVEEIITPKQGITELLNQLEVVYKKYSPLKMVMDEGGLGKKIAEELRKRYTLPIQAAEKSRKLEFIEIMNDAFRTKQLFVNAESRFAKDSQIIEWDYDKSTPDKMVIKRDPHSDIFDALLYSYREALHWLSTPAKPKIDVKNNRTAWIAATEKEIYEKMEIDEANKLAIDESNDFEAISFLTADGEDSILTATRYYLDKRGNK